MRYVRRKHNILIGKRTAEELKIGIACLVPRAEVGIQEVKGRCLTTGLPKSVKISSVELVEAIAEPARDILETIHMCSSARRRSSWRIWRKTASLWPAAAA